jgi:hypothetical protein
MNAVARRRLLLLLGICVLPLACATGVRLFDDYGRAKKAARLSGLLNMRVVLVEFAQAHGRYPDSLWEAVPRECYLYELEQMPLDYLAAGKPYPLEGESPVFCDCAALRYGFDVGWFEFSQHDWSFHTGER